MGTIALVAALGFALVISFGCALLIARLCLTGLFAVSAERPHYNDPHGAKLGGGLVLLGAGGGANAAGRSHGVSQEDSPGPEAA